MKITESELKQLVRESLMEAIQEGDVDEGRFKNFFSSLGKGIQGTVRGGLDQGRQMYNQEMSARSQADADAAETQAAELRKQQNAGYASIPGAQKVAQKYDAKIQKLQGQVDNLKGQIQQLQTQKKEEMKTARKEHMSKTGKQVSKFNKQRDRYANTASNAQNKATDMLNRRRASLGIDPVGPDKDSVRMPKQTGTDSLRESALDKAIRKALRESLYKIG